MVASLHPSPRLHLRGVFRRSDIVNRLGLELGHPVIVPHDAVYAGAIGAALLAWDQRRKREKKELMFFDHLEECLDTGLDLARISLRVIGLDLEEGHVPVLCKILLENRDSTL